MSGTAPRNQSSQVPVPLPLTQLSEPCDEDFLFTKQGGFHRSFNRYFLSLQEVRCCAGRWVQIIYMRPNSFQGCFALCVEGYSWNLESGCAERQGQGSQSRCP